MNLNEIKKSDIVLLDANVLVYGVLHRSEQCTKLLRRCAERDVIGIVGLQQLAEVMHRLMMVEARDNAWTTGGNPDRSLSERPDRVRLMNRYSDIVKGLLASGFKFESLVAEDFPAALRLQREYGLLTNDALFIAIADRLRIQAIASADRQLSNVRGIILYSPNDILEH
ncbi:MAG: type II toxin-antitoxin system VapC family toxin [bacterium]